MNPFLVYKLAIALRLHFTTEQYDIVKMKGRVKTTEQSFAKRHDVVLGVRKVARKYELPQVVDFLVANFVAGAKWARLFDSESESRYKAWQAKMDSLGYLYTQELNTLCENAKTYTQIFDCKRGHPPILKAYLNGEVSIETLVILNRVLPFAANVTTYMEKDIIWPEVALLIRKYTPFVRINKDKYRGMTRKIIHNHFPEEIE